MENKAAEERFIRADGLYRQGEYAASLAVLDELDQAFPNQRRILFPRARCLAKLGRRDEALALCDRLIEEHGYDKARALRDRLLGAEMAEIMTTPGLFDTPARGTPPGGEEPAESGGDGDIHSDYLPGKETKLLFGIRPVRLALLLLIIAAVYFGWMPLWLGAGAVGGYFVIKWLLRRALYRLFSAPFKMKAAALHGAEAEVHSVAAAEAPERGGEEDDDDEAVVAAAPLRWLWLDVTITPAPPKGPFAHWEPGELAVADSGARIKSLDDLDGACQVHDVMVVGEDGAAQPWEGEKYAGPVRLRLRVGLNPAWREGKFVYYTESFGRIDLTAA